MNFKNTSSSFGVISKSLHWVVALAVLGLLAAGMIMTDMPSSPEKFQIYMIHKSVGLAVLALMAARIIWRITNPRPAPVPGHKAWENMLAKAVHFALYAALIALPVSGWVMSSAGDFPFRLFGLADMPKIAPKDEGLFNLTRDMHGAMGTILLILIGLHLAGAMKHHVLRGDETLRRMTSDTLSKWGGVALVGVIAVVFAAPLIAAGILYPEAESEAVAETGAASSASLDQAVPAKAATAPGWVIDPAASAITFEFTQSGEAVTGQFNRWGGKIFFDPENLGGSYVDIGIGLGGAADGMAPVTTGSADRDTQILGPEWFNAAAFPNASFVAERFTRVDGQNFIAHGNLILRGVTKPLDLPFTLVITGEGAAKTATMNAEITLSRLDFGIGQGQWQSTSDIGADVKVSIKVTAALAPETLAP